MNEYPKIMHRGLEEITVHSHTAEAVRMAEGFVSVVPPVIDTDLPTDPPTVELPDAETHDDTTFGAADDGTGEGPTEGAADDETHAKATRTRSKKR